MDWVGSCLPCSYTHIHEMRMLRLRVTSASHLRVIQLSVSPIPPFPGLTLTRPVAQRRAHC